MQDMKSFHQVSHLKEDPGEGNDMERKRSVR